MRLFIVLFSLILTACVTTPTSPNQLATKEHQPLPVLNRKTIKMASYLHEPYVGIARSQYSLGKLRAAQRAMKKAIDNTHNKITMESYQTKYNILSKLLKKTQ